jgi:hypothetical protein
VSPDPEPRWYHIVTVVGLMVAAAALVLLILARLAGLIR